MEQMCLSIKQQETGNHIKVLLKENGYTVKDIQSAMGFENPQAIYKWISGKSLPSIDNFVILSRLLHTSIEDILVLDGGIFFRKLSPIKQKTLCEDAQFVGKNLIASQCRESARVLLAKLSIIYGDLF